MQWGWVVWLVYQRQGTARPHAPPTPRPRTHARTHVEEGVDVLLVGAVGGGVDGEGEDIEIVFTGLRPGEKLYEELITQGEGIVPTQHDKIMVLRRDSGSLSQEEWERQALAGMDELIRVAGTHDAALIRQALKRIIPEYTPSTTLSVLSDASP